MLHTLILFLFLFDSRFPKRKTLLLTASTMIPLMIVNLALFVIMGIEKYGTLMLLTLSLPSFVVFFLMSKYRNGRFFFTFCIVDSVVLEIVYITNILNHYLTPKSYLFMFIVRLLIFPIMEYFVYKKLRPLYLEVQKHQQSGWGIFSFIGLMFYIAITLLMTYPDNIINRPKQIPVLVILCVLMPVIYFDIITTLHRLKRFHEMSEQESIMKLQVSNIVSRVQEYGAANEAFRKERHDFRHKLKVISSLVEEKNYTELERVVDEYKDNFEKTKVVRYSQYPIIDAVLSVYIKKAQENGIETKLGFAFPDKFESSETELATALANAIENAINACEKLPKEERSLEIKVLSSPKFMIMVRNSFDGNISFDQNGIPQNTDEGHGFGTRSIAAFCEKNGGQFHFKAEGKVFTLFMYLK